MIREEFLVSFIDFYKPVFIGFSPVQPHTIC